MKIKALRVKLTLALIAATVAVAVTGCAGTSQQAKLAEPQWTDIPQACQSNQLWLPKAKDDGGAVPLVAIAPQYPARALFKGIVGVVKFGFTVDTHGTPCDAVLLYSSPRGIFEKPALAALAHSTFKSKMVDGKAVTSYATFSYTFQLPKLHKKVPAPVNSPIVPGYPVLALRDHIDGSVTFGFTVDSEGRARDPVVLHASPSDIFDKPAARALMDSQFKIKRVNGKPVPYHATYTYKFDLQASK